MMQKLIRIGALLSALAVMPIRNSTEVNPSDSESEQASMGLDYLYISLDPIYPKDTLSISTVEADEKLKRKNYSSKQTSYVFIKGVAPEKDFQDKTAIMDSYYNKPSKTYSEKGTVLVCTYSEIDKDAEKPIEEPVEESVEDTFHLHRSKEFFTNMKDLGVQKVFLDQTRIAHVMVARKKSEYNLDLERLDILDNMYYLMNIVDMLISLLYADGFKEAKKNMQKYNITPKGIKYMCLKSDLSGILVTEEALVNQDITLDDILEDITHRVSQIDQIVEENSQLNSSDDVKRLKSICQGITDLLNGKKMSRPNIQQEIDSIKEENTSIFSEMCKSILKEKKGLTLYDRKMRIDEAKKMLASLLEEFSNIQNSEYLTEMKKAINSRDKITDFIFNLKLEDNKNRKIARIKEETKSIIKIALGFIINRDIHSKHGLSIRSKFTEQLKKQVNISTHNKESLLSNIHKNLKFIYDTMPSKVEQTSSMHLHKLFNFDKTVPSIERAFEIESNNLPTSSQITEYDIEGIYRLCYIICCIARKFKLAYCDGEVLTNSVIMTYPSPNQKKGSTVKRATIQFYYGEKTFCSKEIKYTDANLKAFKKAKTLDDIKSLVGIK